MQKATFMQKICISNISTLYMYYVVEICTMYVVYAVLLLCIATMWNVSIKRMHIIKMIPLEVPEVKLHQYIKYWGIHNAMQGLNLQLYNTTYIIFVLNIH